jgi:hypothetical protein
MAEEEAPPPVWRGWHVIGRFLPMIFLGSILVLYGISPEAPHEKGLHLGVVFVLAGGMLLIGALIGILFTKCPICYQSSWIFCVQERDVVRVHDHAVGDDYYARDLAYRDNER